MAATISEQSTRRVGEIAYRDRYVTASNGRRLHYLDYGGEGEVVIALHGYVQNAHAFDGIAAALVPHVRLLALDIRGRGGSDWGPTDEYRVNFYLQDFADFLAGIGTAKIAMIGTSLGAVIAILHAMAHPADVTRIVLNDVTFNLDLDAAVAVVQRYGRAPAAFATLADALDWFSREHVLDSLNEDARLAWVKHFLKPLENGGFRFDCDPKLLQIARHARLYWRRSPIALNAFMARTKVLTMPVLIMRGGESDVVSQNDARAMAEAMPSARWMDVPRAGHCPTLYEPEAQAAVREFFGIPHSDRSDQTS